MELRAVVESVNGPVMEELARETGYSDMGAVSMMRDGAPLLRRIPASPECKAQEYAAANDPRQLREECKARNRELLTTLRKDSHAEYLQSQAVEDAQKGRMTGLVKASELDLTKVLLCRRFSREQGFKASGALKLRATQMASTDVHSRQPRCRWIAWTAS